MLKITELIAQAGGQYVQKASHCSLFVACEELDGAGNVMPDKRRNFVENAIEEGSDAQIILLTDLLSMLGITEEELDAIPLPEEASGTPDEHSDKRGRRKDAPKEEKPLAEEEIDSDELTVTVEAEADAPCEALV